MDEILNTIMGRMPRVDNPFASRRWKAFSVADWNADEMEKANDDLAGVQAERDLLERKVNELRRELHAKNKEIEAVDAELKLVKSQQVRAMAKLSVQKAKAEKQLAVIRGQLKSLDEDKAALFREVSSLEAQLAQAQADREESRNWASTYRDMLLKVT